MTERCEEIGGYKIRLQRTDNGDYPRFRVEARNETLGLYDEKFSESEYDGLSKSAAAIGLNRELVLRKFGITP